ncbi:MAG: TonB-dependent receptor [Pseudomonadota bacterium]
MSLKKPSVEATQNSSKSIRRAALLVSVALGVFGSPVLASAQETEPTEEEDPLVQDSIVVTGQKRETTVFESDVAVTVFGAEEIENARIRDFRRLDDLIPNVKFNQSGQTSSIFATIRGVESNENTVNRAAVYIDGIPFRELSNAVLDQVESIEVLRGPQATLYGANSESGLFIINSRQPSEEFEADFRATASFFNDENAFGATGFMGGPIVQDKLFGSLVLSYDDEEAYLQNPFEPSGEKAEITSLFVQGRLTWYPTPDTEIKATAYILDTEAPGLYENEFVPLNRPGFDDNILVDPFTGTVFGPYIDLVHEGRRIGKWEFFSDVPKLTEERDVIAGLSVNQQLDYGELDLAFSYSNLIADSSGLDTDFSALPTQFGFANDDDTIWFAEARFTSPDSDLFEYLIGVSYYQEERLATRNTTVFDAATQQYLPFSDVPEQRQADENIAIFGSTSFGLGIEGLKGTVGLRYDEGERETEQDAFSAAFGQTVFTFLAVTDDLTYDQWLPRFAINYEASENINLYASAAKGFLPGGFNLAASADPTVIADDIAQFGPEVIWSYEAGFKSLFPNGNGFFNGALFYIESDGWQEITINVDPVSGFVTSPTYFSNRANIVSQGFEFEAQYEPTDNWLLNVAFGYTDADYKDFQFVQGFRGQPAQVEDLDGVPVKLVPEYDLNLAAQYDFDSGFFIRGEANFLGETALEERSREIDPNTGRALQEAVDRYNLFAGYETDRFTITLFAENITDERVPAGLAQQNLTFGFDGTFYSAVEAPRIIGAEFSARF